MNGLPSENLSVAWSTLSSQWADTRAEWTDSVSARFEREFWNEWQSALPVAIGALRELEELMDVAKSATALPESDL